MSTETFDIHDALDAAEAGAMKSDRILFELRDTGGDTPRDVRVRLILKLMRRHGFECRRLSELPPTPRRPRPGTGLTVLAVICGVLIPGSVAGSGGDATGTLAAACPLVEFPTHCRLVRRGQSAAAPPMPGDCTRNKEHQA